MKELIILFRALLLVGGAVCLLLFWAATTVLQQIAWATYGAALLIAVIALKDN